MGQRRSPLGVEDLQRLAARGWPAPEQAPLGDWLLRAAGGFTGRANSVLVVGDPGLPLPDAVDAVARWYAERGLTPAAMLPGTASRRADAAFAAAGWQAQDRTLVLTAPLGPAVPPSVPVDLRPAPDDAWLARHRDGALPAGALEVLTGPEDVVFASVGGPGPVVAVARGVLTDGWLGTSALSVAAEHRRRGLATALTEALRGWAVARGAHSSYLQVTEDNAAARALYRRLGHIEHHRYHYRRLVT
ncbi:GNAT family N-acetyltransferase [Modestobacter sp. I12A-02628]|uniref:GNAT family N-acetyltransferase n=1 Tax=Goekera deserti TaxID=2497753 RepID=A0A7K3WCC3_9ACTN|nr:GNAT family N-acetyltransferase [Goekera deserti]MPQ98542.1 GNAT family N-acetyltransferase [Goekera deserti]NDI49087.1 GNAT family N-acetyltransferase [Goekera deserti]NEL54122.1 GNAT family N-acetyltransferase [Goekera deserti]